MDPITAVALAGNVLQFIQFVAGLLDNTRKLHVSATGTSYMNDHFQDICDTLIAFNTQLQQQSVSPTGRAGKLSIFDKPLAECAAACRQECEDLLRILNQLRAIATKGLRYWNSFRAALTEVWKQNEIEELRSRIADRQRQMTLLLCAASNESVQTLENRVRDIGRKVWRLQTGSRLDSIIDEIRSLKNYVREHDKNKLATTTDYITRICAGFSRLSLETRAFEKEARILATLDYSDRMTRHEKIADAHITTFKWGLQETGTTEAEYGKLRRWLKADDALFWVSGKPGSGKSTFMKWIADNSETRKCLTAWAGDHELLIVSHYFTIYGTPIQRSLEGLLRSLVFGILLRKPSLIAKLLVDRWERSWEQPPWTQSELEALLRLFGTETEDLPSKICYFIDGLDEYEGDHLDICQTLKQLSQSPFIKVCVSSRPWNVFEDALGDKPGSKLYMHELTHDDIRDYTASRLQEHTRWSILQEEAGCASSRRLVNEIVAKSNGVFLWVTLVIRQLREGLTNDDSLFDLQRRLSSFPADLEEFFRHIIKAVDPFYNERMAATLLVALEALEPLQLEIYLFHDLEYADEDYALKDPAELMTTDPVALDKLFMSISRRINGRCKGLLERNDDRLEFLHRTVYDFLRTKEMSAFLKGQTRNSHGPSLSILKAFLAWVKRSTFVGCKLETRDPPVSQISGFLTRLRQGLQYARLAEIQDESSATLTAALLENMERDITRMLSQGQIKMTDPSFARDIFRQLVLEAGVGGYTRSKLAVDPKFLTSHYGDRFRSPLYVVLNPSCKLTVKDQYWILNELLKGGHDPQQPSSDPQAVHKSPNPWCYLLIRCVAGDNQPLVFKDCIHWPWTKRLLACAENNILLALLKYGADPTTNVHVRFRKSDVSSEGYGLPVWLAFLLAVTRVHPCKRPTAYEETMLAMLNQVGPLQSTLLKGNLNFWDLCQKSFPLPRETNLGGEDFLIKIFTLILSKIPAHLAAFTRVKDWVSPLLSADANSELAAAVAAAKLESAVRSLKKRHTDDEQEVFGKRTGENGE
ncbi:hypothetical protein F4861DRAFT_528209 [Xylaria intraflava]|nr:hypothetical protein F4861DRAFT_528209 [Xylaria intraflava]